jgi:hypothetical protein
MGTDGYSLESFPIASFGNEAPGCALGPVRSEVAAVGATHCLAALRQQVSGYLIERFLLGELLLLFHCAAGSSVLVSNAKAP